MKRAALDYGLIFHVDKAHACRLNEFLCYFARPCLWQIQRCKANDTGLISEDLDVLVIAHHDLERLVVPDVVGVNYTGLLGVDVAK